MFGMSSRFGMGWHCLEVPWISQRDNEVRQNVMTQLNDNIRMEDGRPFANLVYCPLSRYFSRDALTYHTK
jgi:hypothetical protein